MFAKMIKEAGLMGSTDNERLKQISTREIDIIFKQYTGKSYMDFEKFLEALAHVAYCSLELEGDQ